MRRVVITGIGVISPIGIGSKPFWDNLIAGQIGIARITRFDPSALPCQVAGEIPAFKIGDYVPKSYRKATKVMARDIELAVVAADDAFKDSGLQSKAYTDTPDFDGKRFGCNIGAGLISCELDELAGAFNVARGDDNENKIDLKKWGREGLGQLTPLWLLKYLPNMLACHVTIVHELRGPSNTITCDAASSHLAIGEAFRTIQRGKADLAICGGAESRVNPMGLVRQSLLKRLNDSCNEDPANAMRPFDAAARGTVCGEGGALFILEEYEHAKTRGAKMYAELVGFGASQDVHNIIEPEPSGRSYGKAIEKALKDASLSTKDVGLVIPNGMGIPKYDRAEIAGLTAAFGEELKRVAVAPLKAQFGAMGAGSGIDAAAAVLALHHRKIPASINTAAILDDAPLNIAKTVGDLNSDIAICSVYSNGGQNAALVFRRI